jgi:hypothetical protein
MRTLFILLLWASTVFASPFLVCDPSQVSGEYEIWENGQLAYSGQSEPDGSIRMDLNAVPIGAHNWKIKSQAENSVNCLLTVSLLSYKSDVKSFRYYSITKGWTLKVPASSFKIVN